jgi:hypothetical protein
MHTVDGVLVVGGSLWPQIGTTNSKTHSVHHFQPPTMSISMFNKCGIQACPQFTVVAELMSLLVCRLSQRPQNSAMVSEAFTNRYD